MADLSGKKALVTGGGRGIGAAIARRLAADGADVAVTYVSRPDAAEAVVREIEAAGRRGFALKVDAADAGASARGVEEAADKLGGLDILVANAGIADFQPLGGEGWFASFERTFAVNVTGVAAAADAAARRLSQGGRIVVIGSVNAERVPFPGGSAYGASKAAVAGLVRGWARDLGPKGITANVVQPGPVDTDLNPKDGPLADMIKPFMAIPEYAEGSEVASLVAWIAGPDARHVTGAALTLDGGFLT
jgi:3-oxoacyl-[acyl-carrier protein] reductase